jgi:hypothetical protein
LSERHNSLFGVLEGTVAGSGCRLLVEQLASVDPSHLSHDEKLAFWINLYNTVMMHVCGHHPLCMLVLSGFQGFRV